MEGPRYPEIRVATESPNPFALVAAVRQALRLARVRRREIRAFSDEALEEQDDCKIREACARWVRIESLN